MSQPFSCTEELLLALPQPIAIVDNGAPAGTLGAAIDAHPSVIRLDNYRLDGYEALAGTRSTLRCISGDSDIEVRGKTGEFSPFMRDSRESAAVADFERRNGNGFTLLCARTDVHPRLPTIPKPSTGLALAALCSQLNLQFSLFGFAIPSDAEREALLNLKGAVFYGQSYDYASLYNFCHTEYADYQVNTGLALYRQLGVVIQDEAILEFGAGNGDLSAHMESQGNRVTALEVSKVAFDRIPVGDKIHGDGATLAGLTRKFDRFVSMDVLQHLAENDIRVVEREVARLADAILVSVSTRPSDLLGPKGENLHLTVRPAEWWRDLFSEHFDLQVFDGPTAGQVVMIGVVKPEHVQNRSTIAIVQPHVAPSSPGASTTASVANSQWLAQWCGTLRAEDRVLAINHLLKRRLSSHHAADAWLHLMQKSLDAGIPSPPQIESLLRQFIILYPEHPKSAVFYDHLMNGQPRQPNANSLVFMITGCQRYLPQAERLYAELRQRGAYARIVIGDPTLHAAAEDGPLVRLPVADTYEALPSKVLEGLVFMRRRYGSALIVKIDDDTRLLPNFDPAGLENLIRVLDYVGQPIGDFWPDRCWHLGKTTLPEPLFTRRHHGRFAQGLMYILGPRAVEHLVREWMFYPGEFSGHIYEDRAIGDALRRVGIEVAPTTFKDLGVSHEGERYIVPPGSN